MSEEKPIYYSIIPADVRYDEELTPNEKILYGEITALTNQKGECWATNSYFAKLYKVEIPSVSRWLRHLKAKQYIDIEILYKNNTKEIEKRVIKINGVPINKNVKTYKQNCYGGINKNVKENITSINNKENIDNKLSIQKKVFKKPTLEEVEAYCKERNNNVDAKRFIDFYEANNWTDSKGNKVKSWKQKIITWESHQNSNVKKQEQLPSWWNKTNKDFEEELSEDERKELEAIKNGTYRA